MKQLDLLTISNALTDVVYAVDEEFLEANKLRKGSALQPETDRESLERSLRELEPNYQSPAGSPNNTGFTCATLGLRVGMVGTVGKDQHAMNYHMHMFQHRLKSHLTFSKGPSGVCYTLITPDGERTFFVDIGVAQQLFLPRYLKNEPVPSIVHTSAYELGSPALREYCTGLRERGSLISVDLADPGVCEKVQDALGEFASSIDILFTSPDEYKAAFGHSPGRGPTPPCQTLCLKLGSYGSNVTHGGKTHYAPIFETDIVNLNGSGDSYAAGLFWARANDVNPADWGHCASYVASQTIGRVGAHLEPDERPDMESIVSTF